MSLTFVLTDSPDISRLQDLISTNTSAIVDNNLNPNFTLSVFSSQDLTEELYQPLDASNATEPALEVDKSGSFHNAKVSNETELHYKVSKNTSLLHVFGPVADNRSYAAFRPPPPWWNASSPAQINTFRPEVLTTRTYSGCLSIQRSNTN